MLPLQIVIRSFFGMIDAEEMNPQGSVFQDFLTSHGLFVPSTLPVHKGGSATWTHPRGHQLRRDLCPDVRIFFHYLYEVQCDFGF